MHKHKQKHPAHAPRDTQNPQHKRQHPLYPGAMFRLETRARVRNA